MSLSNKKAALNQKWIVAGVVAILLIIMFAGYVISTYNSFVTSNVGVDTAWSQVETVYQRRADLIPNLVATVEGAKNFEKDTLVEITNARSAWSNAKSNEEKVAAANSMESSLSRLLVVVENYPELKANQNFLALQDELSNTENKIAVERGRYNSVVGEFNTRVSLFPANIIAGMFGFKPRTFFDAAPGAENAPKVEFK